MNKEIKEILDNLDFNINHTKGWVEPLGLNQDTWKILLDYITNLQQEINKLTAKSTEWESKYYEMQDNFHTANDEIERLSNRIDKAIEYINKGEILNVWGNYKPFKEFGYGKDLLNILQNGSDDNE